MLTRGRAVHMKRATITEAIPDRPGSNVTTERRRYVDPLDRLHIPDRLLLAARWLRTAAEHVSAGQPLPAPLRPSWAIVEAAGRLIGPERCTAAALRLRTGRDAVGPGAWCGVICWVVIEQRPMWEYDRHRHQRDGTGAAELVEALMRLAEAYGL